MIVKNEEAIIERCLQSIYKKIDYFIICDTGSTDGTKNKITNFFNNYRILGEIHDHQWVNFGHNRTAALQLCYDKTEWVIMIDADDWIQGEIDLSCLDSSLDAYKVNVGNSELNYPRIQIFNVKNKKWEYKEPIHEYPYAEGNCKIGKITGNYIWVSSRDGNRTKQHEDARSKYFSDYLILKKELEKNPNNPRNQFYAAQSLFDANMIEAAEKEYLKRIDMKGWEDEVFYSWLKVIKCRIKLKKSESLIIEACINAHEVDQERVEHLVLASSFLREKGKPKSAYMFASMGKNKKINYEKLFIHKEDYLWKIYDEIAATAYYAKQTEVGKEACIKLLTEDYLPIEHRRRVESNYKFYY
jgi:glycosyltransferase involved in cell wall biosynthesis